MDDGRPNGTRRELLARLAASISAAVLFGGRRAFAAAAGERRSLTLVHTHIDAKLAVTYFESGAYVPEALAEIDDFLRDWRTGEVIAFDPSLLDLLWDLRNTTGATAPFHVVCGYRSAATNEMLRGRGTASGVAIESQHILGRAIDVRLPGVATARLRDAALALGRGGVGYYAASDFVHLDTGRVRRW